MIVYHMLCLEPMRRQKTKHAMSHNSAINNLAKIVEDIWSKPDCFTFTQKHISKLFEQEVWNPYLYLQCEKHFLGGETTGLNDPMRKKQLK